MPRLKQELTETEIAERAAEIRARWTEPEHRKRAGVVETRWIPPVISPITNDDENLAWLYTRDAVS
jgi:hypothetical protein